MAKNTKSVRLKRIYTRNGISIFVAKATSRPSSFFFKFKNNFPKYWLYFFVTALAFRFLAMTTTYDLVFVNHGSIEYNSFNIPYWAGFGFWLGSLILTIVYLVIPFIFVLLAFILSQKYIKDMVLKELILMVLVALVIVFVVITAQDGLSDAALSALTAIAPSYAPVNYSQLTGCYYAHPTNVNGITLWLNGSYAQAKTLAINLSRCLPIPR
jgi:uncharacterized membrane protein